MRKAVKKFAEAMEAKLKEHDADRGISGWDEYSPQYFLSRLLDEIEELSESLTLHTFDHAKREAADIGNFAMMIFDICDKLLDDSGE
jgi:NTP pyrophosphatase (non-canonical NTP hydrolase)